MACVTIVGHKTQQWLGCGGTPAMAGDTAMAWLRWKHPQRHKKFMAWVSVDKRHSAQDHTIQIVHCLS